MLCDFFEEEKLVYIDKYPSMKDVKKLIVNFDKTTIYKDAKGKKLRTGNNSMLSMFLKLFAMECYSRFHLVLI